MNIFFLDKDPVLSANMLCDKHIVKMALETAQMVSTCAHLQGHKVKYRPTHKNHPCTIWARSSKKNWEWCINHGLAICAEYTRRYGRTHKSEQVIRDVIRFNMNFTSIEFTNPPQAMPDQYRSSCPISSYRSYYQHEKAKIAVWNHSKRPKWWNNVLTESSS